MSYRGHHGRHEKDETAATRKTKPPPRVSVVLRRAIADSGKRLYDVARAAGIPYSTMSRFVAGERVLALEDVDRLCQALDLELRPRKRPSEC